MTSKRLTYLVLVLLMGAVLACGELITLEDGGGYFATANPSNIYSGQELESDYLPTVLAKIQGEPIAENELPVRAVVQIVVSGRVEGYLQEWSGSGTIISPDGYILTNAHVAMGDRFYPAEELLIMLTVAEDQLPEAAFYAEVVQADQALDIAVLRPAFDLHGNPIQASQLNLPFVALGDSDLLHLGDDIAILGYPGIGGDTVTLTRGEVSGFTSEKAYGNRAFIKTSATIAGGNSGGSALSRSNQLIGIPTQVGAGDIFGDIVDCRPLADTNRDGSINQYDTCVPTGGFINALRPIKLAMPLIEAAMSGRVAFQTQALPQAEIPTASKLLHSDDFSDPKSGWPGWDNIQGAVYYKNGRYWIDVRPANRYTPVTYGEVQADVVMQIDARVEKSSQDGEYGLICRAQDENNLYIFEVTQDGFFAIYKLRDGSWYPLVDYTYTDLLDGLEEAAITASCVGNTFSLAVDGKLLAEAQDNTIRSGKYGLFAGTFNNGNIIVSFDDLVVSQP